ncbi:MAG: type II toxin-antitoxin system prevent-host-death family antitoxin [Spirochaetes bacterium]|nr:type II toxin-antitoxin system prevent-host-death family antitoxin [Spirochaetota bacterium]
MKTLTISKLKANFSKILEDVKRGEEIIVEFGKQHEKLIVIIPYKKYRKKKRRIGILKDKASYKIKDDFKITDEEILS